MEEKIQHLLNKFESVKLRLEFNQHTNRFNIFRILRQGHEEVSVHSRFIYELLNPKGSHGMGNIFLHHFAEICKLPSLSYDTVQVLREHASIDILIQDNQHSVVIENKIYASDQREQLKRYYEYASKSYCKPSLFYLTLDGKKPSGWSIGDLTEQVHLLSYSEQIDQWITACIKEAATHATLRETLLQYQTLIGQLTGNTMSEIEKQEVLRLVAQDDNAEKAVIIARNWNHVRWHAEWDFWTELEALVESAYTIIPDGKFSDDAISTMVHGQRNKNPWYGLSFSIGKLNGITINFRIERNDGPTYYGLPYCPCDENTRSRIRESIKRLVSYNTKGWAGLKDTNCGIDFQSFRNQVTLELINPSKRQKIVRELWEEIQSFITESVSALQTEFGFDFVLVNK